MEDKQNHNDETAIEQAVKAAFSPATKTEPREFLRLLSTNMNIIKDELDVSKLSQPTKDSLIQNKMSTGGTDDREAVAGQDMSQTFKFKIVDVLRSVVSGDQISLEDKMQALKLCNLGLLSSKDMVDGFDPKVWPLKDLKLLQLLKMNGGLATDT